MNKINYENIRENYRLSEYFENKSGQSPDRRGRYFFYKCPFHEENTPSFSITDDNGVFFCYGCGKHGDVCDLAKFYGDEIDLEKYKLKDFQNIQCKPNIESDLSLIEPAPLPDELVNKLIKNLWQDDEADWAMKLLLDRGIKKETIKTEGLGYTWRRNGRITIPLFSVLSKDAVDIRCYSPHSQSKNISYFNNSRVKRYPFIPLSCREKGSGMVWIVEGELDAILLGQESDCLVVSCISGAASLPGVWSDKGWRRFINKANVIIIATDADKAGESARNNLIKHSLFGFDGIIEYVVWPEHVPNGYDITDFFKEFNYTDLCRMVSVDRKIIRGR